MVFNENPLEAIAEAIADGKELDWDSLLTSHPHLAHSLHNLRRLDSFSGQFKHDRREERATAPRTWGHLKVLEKIGEGTYGEVFRAEDSVLERQVALKLRRALAESEITSYQRQLQEARRLARIQHPNVLTVHGIEIHDGRPGIWTDFVEGVTLEELVDSSGPFSTELVAQVAIDLSRALVAVHAADLVHGDVKAANVMQQEDCTIVLMDFGAGRGSRDQNGPAFLPEGTPIAMAPEILDGAAPSVASDLYSLGVLLYRIATGHYPVEAADLSELRKRVVIGAKAPLGEVRPDLPEGLARTIHRLLARFPQDRPSSAVEVENELRISLERLDDRTEVGSLFPHNLPDALHRFIGRRSELLEASQAITEPNSLISLIGPGGAGKTRLALEMSRLFLGRFPDGVWWVDLTTAVDDDGVVEQILRSLRVPNASETDRFAAIHRFLRDGHRLLVFDNAEQVSKECASRIGQLQESCPDLKFLATSRIPLDVDHQTQLRLSPLAVPPEPTLTEPAGTGIHEFESVRLLVERIHQVRQGFVLNSSNANAVARICRRLDGIPLGLELAAARTRTFSLEELAQQLDASFRIVLNRGESKTLSPHATLQASIDWSYDLLSVGEKELFARLSVFRGGWTLHAAMSVCGSETENVAKNEDTSVTVEPGEETAAEETVSEDLASLVEKSLVVFHPERGLQAARYTMLEVVRESAHRRLESLGDEPARRRQHLRAFCEFAREAKVGLLGPDAAAWFVRLRQEHENIERALDFETLDADSTREAMILFESSARSWTNQGLAASGIRRAKEILARSLAQEPTPHRAGIWTWLGMMREMIGDHEGAIEAHRENQQISLENGSQRSVAVAQFNISTSFTRLGRLDEAYEQAKLSLITMEAIDDLDGIAHVLGGLGLVQSVRGKFEESLDFQRRALAIQRRQKSAAGVALTAHNVATSLVFLERVDEAELLAKEALELRKAAGDKAGVASTTGLIGTLEKARKNYPSALEFLRDALALYSALELNEQILNTLELIVAIAAEVNATEDAATLLAATRSARTEHQAELHNHAQESLLMLETEIRNHLGDERYDSCTRRGSLMTLEDSIAFAESHPSLP